MRSHYTGVLSCIAGLALLHACASDPAPKAEAPERAMAPLSTAPFVSNGQAGFGGALGLSALSMTDDGITLSSTLVRGPGAFEDAIVLYFDTRPGGISSTASLADPGLGNTDYGRKAVSGYNGGTAPEDRSVVEFPTGFLADYAIVLSANTAPGYGGSGNLFELSATSTILTWVSSVNLAPIGTTTSSAYTFETPLASLGISQSSGQEFMWVATYLNGNTTFRSNEAIGKSNATGQNPGNAPLIFSASARYVTQGLAARGNGRTGFGGVIGSASSTLSLADDGMNLWFSFTKGPGDFNDALVVYLDTGAGGITTTAGLSDAGDYLRKAVSGFSGTERSVVTFAGGFVAGYAIGLNPNPTPGFGNFGNLFAISGTTNTLSSVGSVFLAPLGTMSSSTYTFSATLPSVGLTPYAGQELRYLATYLNAGNAYRSNEAFGMSDVGDQNPGTAAVHYTGWFSHATKRKEGPGGECAHPSDCQSGFCVDYVCCNQACGGTNLSDCQACNLQGSVGTCSPLPIGTSCANGTCTAPNVCSVHDSAADALSTPDVAVDGPLDVASEAEAGGHDASLDAPDVGADGPLDAVAEADAPATIEAGVDAESADAGVDAVTSVDAGGEPREETGTVVLDAGAEATVADVALDVVRDVGQDVMSDTPADTPADTPVDGSVDVAVDAPRDNFVPPDVPHEAPWDGAVDAALETATVDAPMEASPDSALPGVDAGSKTDARVDAGVSDFEIGEPSGCSCRTHASERGQGHAATAMGVLVALALVRRRRRTGEGRPAR